MASSSGREREEVGPFLLDVVAKVASGSQPEAPDADQRFPRHSRLTARREFRAVYDNGRKNRRPAFTVFGLPNQRGHCRLGLTVTRRVGGAVVRNRIKRRMRDVFRRHRALLPGSLDLVFNAHRSVLDLPIEQLEQELLGAVAELARKSGGRPRRGAGS